MKRVALLCPNSWDDVQLQRSRPRWADRFEVVPYGSDAEDDPASFDALAFVDHAVRDLRAQGIDGVASSSDYPGTLVAAAVASELGLPGPAPAAVLRCSHKYYARLAQQAAVPEATPPFWLIDPDRPLEAPVPVAFPCFVKPVKSWFSVFAQRMDSPAELRAFLARPDVRAHLTAFVAPFNQMIGRYADFTLGGGYLLAEGLLGGQQVTVEGFAAGGRVTIVGVVDSVMFPGTISFQRFDYPSSLPPDVQARMADIARRAISGIGLDQALFNVEMLYDAGADRISIIEINPRMCGQFADLYECVDGTNTYEVLLALACGEAPRFERGAGKSGVAASCPLRVFRDMRVVRVPAPEDVAAVRRDLDVTLVKSYYAAGARLSDGNQGDGITWRYGMVNLAAPDRATLLANLDRAQQCLGFVLEDLT